MPPAFALEPWRTGVEMGAMPAAAYRDLCPSCMPHDDIHTLRLMYDPEDWDRSVAAVPACLDTFSSCEVVPLFGLFTRHLPGPWPPARGLPLCLRLGHVFWPGLPRMDPQLLQPCRGCPPTHTTCCPAKLACRTRSHTRAAAAMNVGDAEPGPARSHAGAALGAGCRPDDT